MSRRERYDLERLGIAGPAGGGEFDWILDDRPPDEPLAHARGELPDGGSKLHDGERSRGWITTAVRSPRPDPIALGYLHRSMEPGLTVTREAGAPLAARVMELPFEGAFPG